MNWQEFIKQGFDTDSEVKNAKKNREFYKSKIEPSSDDLYLKWYKKNGLKYYTVVCKCGNNRMLYHENGIRCHICGRFHSHEHFSKMSQKAKNASKFNDGKIAQIPQPFKQQYANRVQNRNIIQRSILNTAKSVGFRGLGSG